VFVFFREGSGKLLKTEAVPKVNRWGGLAVGVARGIFLSGFICFIFVISTVGYCKVSVQGSYLGRRFFTVAPAVYRGIWDGVVSKFMVKEKFNKVVVEVEEDFNRETR